LPANNSIYDSNASNWWNEQNFLSILKTGLNSARFHYFSSILNLHNITPAGLKVLDMGCGGGFLSEDFAQTGSHVVGLDLSYASIAVAKAHAAKNVLVIDYCGGSACEPPFPDWSFDLVSCCDVLEHLTNFDCAVREAARVLRPGGFFVFDTVNRTLRSYLETILVAQTLPLTKFFPAGTHDWKQFIPPNSLEQSLKKHHLTIGELRGLHPGISSFKTLLEILRLKFGKINFSEFGERLKFRLTNNLEGSYIGYAIKSDNGV
jgi:2-polyprenyl-6-hydroxyphenyl methylase / 3-demethylubiquinone-9 3-methyltransferase